MLLQSATGSSQLHAGARAGIETQPQRIRFAWLRKSDGQWRTTHRTRHALCAKAACASALIGSNAGQAAVRAA